jgi:hypothetical protein
MRSRRFIEVPWNGEESGHGIFFQARAELPQRILEPRSGELARARWRPYQRA